MNLLRLRFIARLLYIIVSALLFVTFLFTLSGCKSDDKSLSLNNYKKYIKVTAQSSFIRNGFGFQRQKACAYISQNDGYEITNITITFRLIATAEGTSSSQSVNTKGQLFDQTFTEIINDLQAQYSKAAEFDVYYNTLDFDVFGPRVNATVAIISISGDISTPSDMYWILIYLFVIPLALFFGLYIFFYIKRQNKLAKIEIGMTYAAVVEILGEPNIYQPAAASIATAIWQHLARRGWRNYCTLTLKDNIVISIIIE